MRVASVYLCNFVHRFLVLKVIPFFQHDIFRTLDVRENYMLKVMYRIVYRH